MDLRAVIFVPALAGTVIFGFAFALFAAHAYLTVLQSTGSGSREVGWTSEPILDHFWKVFYLAWLIGLWLGPAYLVGRAYTAGSESAWLRLAVPLAVFWLLYPLSQLSSLSASTIWVPLHPDVFARLVQRPGAVIGFLVLSGAVLAVFGVAFKWTFLTEGRYDLLLIGCPLLIISGLLYGRLLGRLAYSLMFTKKFLLRKKKKKRARDDEGGERDRREPTPDRDDAAEPRVKQASDLPPIMTPDEGPLTGYDFQSGDDEPMPKKPRRRVVAEAVEAPDEVRPRPRHLADEDGSPYEVNAPELELEDVAPVEVVKPSALEMRLLDRTDAPKPIKRVWSADLFAFLGQSETVATVGMLSVMCALAGLMVRIARAFNPVSGG
jgi:hypothetical protein